MVCTDTYLENPPKPQPSVKPKKKKIIRAMTPFLDALKDLYRSFKNSQIVIRDGDDSPPSKRLRTFQDHVTIRANTTIHQESLQSTHYEVHLANGGMYTDFDDSEDDEEGDSISEEGTQDINSCIETQREAETNKFILLRREICNLACCFTNGAACNAAMAALGATIPTSVSWEHGRKTRTTCPICSSVLFLRNGMSRDGVHA